MNKSLCDHPKGKTVILLHSYIGEHVASNLLSSYSILYEACESYKLKVLDSLWNPVNDQLKAREVIQRLQNHKKTYGQKLIVITNNYKLAENYSPENNKLSSLITSGIIGLYQVKRAVVLTKIEVDHA